MFVKIMDYLVTYQNSAMLQAQGNFYCTGFINYY